MSRILIINNTVELLRLRAADIVYVEAEGNYSKLHIVGDEQRTMLIQLGQLEQMMGEQLADEAAMFVRVGRGFIVNRNYIYNINLSSQYLIMRDAQGRCYPKLRISHDALKKLKDLVASDSGKED
jgi:DNA-binding LytR/AlgR family response regulator